MTEQTNSSRKSSMQTEASTSLILPQVYSQPLSVFVGALPKTASEDKLSQFMSQFGYVKDVYISKDGASGGHYGFAFVNFAYVNHVDKLFGPHNWLGKQLEVKRSLQEYITLRGLPNNVHERDVAKAFQHLGYSISEVLIGGKIPGVPLGTAGVKLKKFGFQVQVAKLGTINILGKKVKMMQFIPKRVHQQLSHENKPERYIWKPAARNSFELDSQSRSPISPPDFLSTGPSRGSFSNSQEESTTSFEVWDRYSETGGLSPSLGSNTCGVPTHEETLTSSGCSAQICAVENRLTTFQPRSTSGCSCERHFKCPDCFGTQPCGTEILLSFFAFPGHL